MKGKIFMLTILFLLLSCVRFNDKGPYPDRPGNNTGDLDTDIYAWITSPQRNVLFQQQNFSLNFVNSTNTDPVIVVDTTITYQTIDGFGNCLTGGSAIVINKMARVNRTNLLKELFSTEDKNIGISYLRISIGASALSDRPFS